MKPILILCLGNEVLSDDAFGPTIAATMIAQRPEDERVDVVFAPVAGFSLLDLLNGREKALVIDSIVTGQAPAGTLHYFPLGNLTPSRNLTTSHQMSLPTAMELGRRMGYQMPERLDVLAVEVADITTLNEEMTDPVKAAIVPAMDRIDEWLVSNLSKDTNVARRTKIAL